MPKGLAELPVSWLLSGAEEQFEFHAFTLRWSDFADICWRFRLEAMSAAYRNVRVTAGAVARPPSRSKGGSERPGYAIQRFRLCSGTVCDQTTPAPRLLVLLLQRRRRHIPSRTASWDSSGSENIIAKL